MLKSTAITKCHLWFAILGLVAFLQVYHLKMWCFVVGTLWKLEISNY